MSYRLRLKQHLFLEEREHEEDELIAVPRTHNRRLRRSLFISQSSLSAPTQTRQSKTQS